ncbi:MAG TPA: hypothetical protein VKZ60_07220 [Chloroflexota bacterium]|jgi:hypothetical protein|nr:hypothetical protein [Chloroflexota bacterium]
MKRLFQRQGRGRGHPRRELECLYCGKIELVEARDEGLFTRHGCGACRARGAGSQHHADLAALFRQMLVRHQLKHVTGPDYPCSWPDLARRFERLAGLVAASAPRPAPHPCEHCYWRAEGPEGTLRCALHLTPDSCGQVAVPGERPAIAEAQQAFRALPTPAIERPRRRRRPAPEQVRLGELARDLLANLPPDEAREFLAYIASHSRRDEHGERYWCDCCAEHEDATADSAWHPGAAGEHVYVYTDLGYQVLCPECFGNQASVRCGRCGLFFDRYSEGETLVVDALGYASLFCFACAYPLLYGLDDFSADAREEILAEIKRHGWRLLEDLPDDPEPEPL